MTIIVGLTTKHKVQIVACMNCGKVIAEERVLLVLWECRDGVSYWDFWARVWGDEPLVFEPGPFFVAEAGPSSWMDLASGVNEGETQE